MEATTRTVYTLDRKLWLTADKERVVEDGSSEAAFLFGVPGDEITSAEAERYGLVSTKKADTPANKAQTGKANK